MVSSRAFHNLRIQYKSGASKFISANPINFSLASPLNQGLRNPYHMADRIISTSTSMFYKQLRQFTHFPFH